MGSFNPFLRMGPTSALTMPATIYGLLPDNPEQAASRHKHGQAVRQAYRDAVATGPGSAAPGTELGAGMLSTPEMLRRVVATLPEPHPVPQTPRVDPTAPQAPPPATFAQRFGNWPQPAAPAPQAPAPVQPAAMAQAPGPAPIPMPMPRPAEAPQAPTDTGFFGANGPIFGASKYGPSFHDWMNGSTTPAPQQDTGDQGGNSLINKMLSYFHQAGNPNS